MEYFLWISYPFILLQGIDNFFVKEGHRRFLSSDFLLWFYFLEASVGWQSEWLWVTESGV
jgi:hypothetical protein